MKKKLLIIVLLLGLLIIPFRAVSAEGEENAWPKSFTNGDYSYTIEGIVINVFEMENTTSEEENDEATKEVFMKYVSGTPDRVINLDPTKYTLDPTYKEGKFTDKDATYIDLGLDIKKEDLEELLRDEIAATTETKSYLADIVVQYKVTNYPEEYKYVYNRSLMRETFDLLVNSEENAPATKNLTPQDMTKTINQVFNGAITQINSETGEAELEYNTEFSNDNSVSSFAYGGLMFLEKAYGSVDNNGYVLVFHDVDNVDDLMEGAENIGFLLDMDFSNIDWEELFTSGLPEESTSAEAAQNVIVPDTAKNFSLYLYFFSIIVMASGLGIIARAVYKEQQAKY